LADILGSSFQEWNLLPEGTRISLRRKGSQKLFVLWYGGFPFYVLRSGVIEEYEFECKDEKCQLKFSLVGCSAM
jgi:hypothetical protein